MRLFVCRIVVWKGEINEIVLIQNVGINSPQSLVFNTSFDLPCVRHHLLYMLFLQYKYLQCLFPLANSCVTYLESNV